MKFTLTHEINCDVDTFWKMFFDKPFNEALYKECLQFPRYSIIDQNETDKEITRKVTAEPKMDLPGPLKKLLGNSFGYTEDSTFDKSTKISKWKVTPTTMADKMKNEGVIKLEPAGAGHVKRIVDIIMEAK